MDECIDSLGYETMFQTLDANSGYLQVEVADKDREKTLSRLTTGYSVLFQCYSA